MGVRKIACPSVDELRFEVTPQCAFTDAHSARFDSPAFQLTRQLHLRDGLAAAAILAPGMLGDRAQLLDQISRTDFVISFGREDIADVGEDEQTARADIVIVIDFAAERRSLRPFRPGSAGDGGDGEERLPIIVGAIVERFQQRRLDGTDGLAMIGDPARDFACNDFQIGGGALAVEALDGFVL